jgi:hypothetical protein
LRDAPAGRDYHRPQDVAPVRRLGATDAHLVSACCHQHGLLLGHVAVADTASEVGAVRPLLGRLTLAGETVIFDALFTQTAIARRWSPVARPTSWWSRATSRRISNLRRL